MDRLYSLIFMVVLTIAMAGTALAYLRSAHPRQRVLSLLVGIVLIIVIVTVATTVYWSENGWVDVERSVGLAVIVVAVLFSPVPIGRLRRSMQHAG